MGTTASTHGDMATSIRVSRQLHARLEDLKERMKAKTFEELFRRLLERPWPSPWERFGAHPDMKPFEHRDWRPHSEAGRGEWGA